MKTPTLQEVTIIEKLQQVSWEIANLNVEDAEGHIWWNKFKEFLIKGTDIIECKKCEGSGFYYSMCNSGHGDESCEVQQCEECCCNGYLVNDVVLGISVKIEHSDDLPF